MAHHPADLTDRHPVAGGELVEAAVLGAFGRSVATRHTESLPRREV
jgi:hypothetical protein